jgi:hypothetical protein
MPALCLTAFVLHVVAYFANEWVTASGGAVQPPSGEDSLAAILSTTVEGFVITPLAIGTQRFVLLGETTHYYRPAGADWRSLRYFAYSMLLGSPFFAIFLIPSLLQWLPHHAIPLLIFTAAIGFYVFINLEVRLALLFPATAVDSPLASLSTAFRLSNGRFWRIVTTLFLAFAPALLLAIGIGVWLGLTYGTNARPFSLADPLAWVSTAIEFMVQIACAAAAARIFDEIEAPDKADNGLKSLNG